MIKKLFIVTLLLLVSLITTVSKTYALLPMGMSWESINIYSTNYGMWLQFDFPVALNEFTVTIPLTSDNLFSKGNIDSTITVYTGVGLTGDTTTFKLSDLSYTVDGTYVIEYGGTRSVSILIMQDYTSTPSGYVNYYNENSEFIYDIYTVKFYSGVTLIESEYFYGIPDEPIDPIPPVNYEFVGWKTIDQVMYDFTWVDGTMVNSNRQFLLYAHYKSVLDVDYDTDDPDLNTPTQIQTLLTGLGLYNVQGFLMIYVVGILIATGLLLSFKASTFVFMIIYFLITTLFIFLGMLPLFAIIIIVLVLILGIIYNLKGGQKDYE